MKGRLIIIMLIFSICRIYSQTDTGKIIRDTYDGMRNNPKYSKLFDLEGKQIPNWNFSKLDSMDSKIDLNNYKGKVVLVFFTATYCGYCNLALPFLKGLESKYDSNNFLIIAIFDNKSKKIQKHIIDKQIDFTCFKYNGKLKNIFDSGFPTFLIIDKDSKVKRAMIGYDTFGIRKKEIIDFLDN
jgi:cytochrome c biogenesis protein CcmG, thiol:disulfide interchange protein DsbE